jgi:predicted 2-oxoglutarate/Fe(II)-dependent dioxygenase YbiX
MLSKESVAKLRTEFPEEDGWRDGLLTTGLNPRAKRRKEFDADKALSSFLDRCVIRNHWKMLNAMFDGIPFARDTYRIAKYTGDSRGFYRPHRDSDGFPKRRVSCVLMLSDPDEYSGGALHFPELRRDYREPAGRAVVFRSHLTHGVKEVTSGTRYICLTFFYEMSVPRPVAPLRLGVWCLDSGIGNQMGMIKEAMVVAAHMGCPLVLPDLAPHYLYQRRHRDWKMIPIGTFFRVEGHAPAGSDPAAPVLRFRNRSPEDEAGGRTVASMSASGVSALASCRRVRTPADLDLLEREVYDLAEGSEGLLLAFPWHNVKLSACVKNGCVDCPRNEAMSGLYDDVCRRIDFAPEVHAAADAFLTEAFGSTTDFDAVHFRTPDIPPRGYPFEKVLSKVLAGVCGSVYVASNAPKLPDRFRRFRPDPTTVPPEWDSIVEMCICCKARRFFASRHNTPHLPPAEHPRSTWSQFVMDYRRVNGGLPSEVWDNRGTDA